MNLIPWHAKHPAGGGVGDAPGLRHELARIFSRMDEDPWSIGSGLLGRAGGLSEFMPALDVTEDDKQVTVKAELPGVDPENVDVTVDGNILTLSGRKEESHEDQGKDYYRSERTFGSFRRRVELPQSVDPDNVDAQYDNGVLTVHLAKKSGAGVKKIPISPAGGRRQGKNP